MRELLTADPHEVGPYRLLARLGGGGMGQVFLGRSPGGRTVAVKLVRAELAEDRQFRLRFAREVEAARRVGGFYTAQVVDADTDAVPPWLVTSYIAGPSLREAVSACGPLPDDTVAALGAGLAEGLKAIHACGVVHRDLKPGNVIVADDGPRVIDFGIARALDATSHLTHAGVIGTPAFMAPEQIRGAEATPAGDVFCLAAVLAYSALGRGPFGDGPTEAVIYRVVHGDPDLSGLSADLTTLVAAGLEKDPEDRPEVAEVLDLCAALAGSGGLRLPPDVGEMISRQAAETAVLTTRTPADPPTGPVTPPPPLPPRPPVPPGPPTAVTEHLHDPGPPTRVEPLRTIQAEKGAKKGGYTPVLVPWLPGERAGARRTTVLRWNKRIGDDVAVNDTLFETTSVHGDIAISSPVKGTLLIVYRGAGRSARTGSVIAGIGTPGSKITRRPWPRPARITAVLTAWLAALAAIAALVILLAASVGPLYSGDIAKAKVGDCVAQEYDKSDTAHWITKPCFLMRMRKSLKGSGNKAMNYYGKVTMVDPPKDCDTYDPDWQRDRFEHVSFCTKKL
ncbi:Serine/threonine protein kinase [Actinacidiphila yanglinensis]|uniref:Serine/threonine protein kinase n=1 Tax=Actinacidiphila yanglinensis TaxID=310779 RepID=A0A1H5S4T0_9ACTN|nr:serine/threonine-protein kinase [Actinacidiphila yanglinensis]SEF45626.1 Serine/threonine protein kinase [Actinacidiphila yanglinensis]